MKLKDIADMANVSVSTVSRILNNKGNFSDETKQKVMEVVNEYLYKPGTVLTNMQSAAYSLAIFVPASSDFIDDNPLTSVDLNSLREELENLGHQISIFTNTGKIDRGKTAFRVVQEKKIDAAIVFDAFEQDETIELLSQNKIPFILTNGRSFEKDWSFIDYDNRDGAAQVIDYLYELGHRSIGLITGPLDRLVSSNRLLGCKDAMTRLGIQGWEGNIHSGPFSLTHGYEATAQMLKNKQITAIFAFSDILAFGAMKAIHESGLRIPEHISIVGFDDVKISELMMPPLTTVKRFKYDINQLFGKLIDEIVRNDGRMRIWISLKTEIVIRNSCAPNSR